MLDDLERSQDAELHVLATLTPVSAQPRLSGASVLASNIPAGARSGVGSSKEGRLLP
jgi:hypothetical protein